MSTFVSCTSNLVGINVTNPDPPAQPVFTSMSLAGSPNSGPKPLSVTFSGRLVRNDTGAGLAAQNPHILYNGSDTGATVTTDPNGYYTFNIGFPNAGNYAVQTSFPGTTAFKGCYSEIV